MSRIFHLSVGRLHAHVAVFGSVGEISYFLAAFLFQSTAKQVTREWGTLFIGLLGGS